MEKTCQASTDRQAGVALLHSDGAACRGREAIGGTPWWEKGQFPRQYLTCICLKTPSNYVMSETQQGHSKTYEELQISKKKATG